MARSKKGKIDGRDWLHGALISLGTGVLTTIVGLLQKNEFNWHTVLLSLLSGVVYLLKQGGTTSDGVLLGKEKNKSVYGIIGLLVFSGLMFSSCGIVKKAPTQEQLTQYAVIMEEIGRRVEILVNNPNITEVANATPSQWDDKTIKSVRKQIEYYLILTNLFIDCDQSKEDMTERQKLASYFVCIATQIHNQPPERRALLINSIKLGIFAGQQVK